MITGRKVLVSGALADNPARQVAPGDPLEIVGPPPRFVSRGGEKLDAALDRFAIDVEGKRALDVGASTGGFTDCLLQRGAVSVVALDVGHGQLHERLRSDPRVVVMERTNVRHLELEAIGAVPFPLVTVDVSFISLRTIASVIVGAVAVPGADVLTLIKPQFEAGRAEVSKGKGVVRDLKVRLSAVADVVSTMADLRAATMGLMASPITGAEGNVEFLAWFKTHQDEDFVGSCLAGLDIESVVSSDTF